MIMKRSIPFFALPVLGLSVFVYLLFAQPAFLQKKVVALDGLGAAVRVYDDAHGVPHVFAQTPDDAYAALGFLHARDRLFQMMMMRRAASGRLAEVLGADLLGYDKKMRVLGFSALAKKNLAALAPDAQRALEAYARGVNAFLLNHQGLWPAEFFLLNMKPEPWQVADGLLWAKMMAWQLSANLDGEIFRAQLLKKGMTPAQIETLFPATDTGPVTVAPFKRVEAPIRGVLAQTLIPFEDTGLCHHVRGDETATWQEPPLPHQASNIFVLAGGRTKTGKPILVNDPHLQLGLPALWYLVRITTPDGLWQGATAPGMPFLPLGQNSHVAWGFTTNGSDVMDLLFVPEKNLSLQEEKIAVKGGSDLSFTARRTADGPVISDVMPEVAAITPPGHVAVLKFTGFDENDRTAEALYRMNHARSVADVESAAALYHAPPQNLMAADDAGAVAFFAVGAVPLRAFHDGFYPHTVMHEGGHVWPGVTPQRPQLLSPPEGMIANANNAVVGKTECAPPACFFTREWAEPFRAARLEALLRDAPMLDAQGAAALVLDDVSLPALQLLPLMLKDIAPRDADEKALLAALGAFDGRMDRARAEPMLFHAWLQVLLRDVFGGVAAAPVLWPRVTALAPRLAVMDVERRRAALDSALQDLRARFGADWRKWRWGDAHQAQLVHPVWSKIPLLRDVFAATVPTDGDGYTLRRAAPLRFDGAAAFEDAHGAGYRAAYDLANPAHSLFMIAGGQSGAALHAHYADLVPAWARGDFIGLEGDEDTLKQAGGLSLSLRPAR